MLDITSQAVAQLLSLGMDFYGATCESCSAGNADFVWCKAYAWAEGGSVCSMVGFLAYFGHICAHKVMQVVGTCVRLVLFACVAAARVPTLSPQSLGCAPGYLCLCLCLMSAGLCRVPFRLAAHSCELSLLLGDGHGWQQALSVELCLVAQGVALIRVRCIQQIGCPYKVTSCDSSPGWSNRLQLVLYVPVHQLLSPHNF